MAIFDTLDTRKLAVLTSGTPPNYTVTLTSAPTAYTQGMSFPIIIHSTLPSIGGATLNVNGLGAKNLKVTTSGSSRRDPVVGELSARQVYFVTYESALDSFQIANPTFAGYPIGFNPTVSSSTGTATLNGTGNDSWYAYQSPTLIRVHYQAHISLAGAASSRIHLSLPLNNDLDDNITFGVGYAEVSTGYTLLSAECFIVNNVLRFYRTDNVAWAVDSSFYLYATVFYKIVT